MDGILLSEPIAAPPSGALNLAEFDCAPDAPLDEQIWRKNLAALHAVQSDLASDLARCPAPPARPATALDDFPTFVTTGPAGETAWRCGAAAPQVRAEAAVNEYRCTGHNAALPAIGTGAELLILLARLPASAAVFVFEQDVRELAAVLRRVDLSVPLAAGRCIFAIGDGGEQQVERFLAERPGLLAPGQLVRTFDAPPDRVAAVRAACERLFRKTAQHRATRLCEIAARVSSERRHVTSVRRLALVDFRVPACTWLSAALSEAARRLGWSFAALTVDGPNRAHALRHYDDLVGFDPDLSIFVAGARTGLPKDPPGLSCDLYLDSLSVPAALPPGADLVAGTTPAIRAALAAAGAEPATTFDLLWAANEPLSNAEPAESSSPGSILLVADRPDARPEACGLDQPTQRQLWELARRHVAQHWQSSTAYSPERVLAAAERAVGARLTDTAQRASFLGQIERALIPATIAERICAALETAAVPYLVVGKGWSDCTGERRKILYDSAEALVQRPPAAPPRAVIFPASRDPLSPQLVHAAMHGWPLILHDPQKSLGRLLGGVLQPQRHVTTFSTATALVAAARDVLVPAPALRERAAYARQHVRTTATWTTRLTSLATAALERASVEQ